MTLQTAHTIVSMSLGGLMFEPVRAQGLMEMHHAGPADTPPSLALTISLYLRPSLARGTAMQRCSMT